MKKTAILIMCLTMLSKVFGFGRDMVLSFYYGATSVSDAYLISMTIPSVIFSFVGAGISTGYIPMYSKIKNDEGEENAHIFTSNLVNILLVMCIGVTILGMIFTSNLVSMFASGFEGETLDLAIKFTRISLIGINITAILYVFTPFLQLNGNYAIPALIGFPLNLITVIFIVISGKTNVLLLAVGTLIATISQLGLLIPFIKKKKYKHSLSLNLKDKHIKMMLLISIPIILGTSVNDLNVLIDRTIASSLEVGSISALNYAGKLNGFVRGIFVVSITTVLYPTISKMAAEGNMVGLKKNVSQSIVGISLLVIPVSVGAMIFAEPIVSLLFGRGAFDDNAVKMTSTALFYYSVGMLWTGLRDVLSKAFYSIQDTKTPVINATIGVVVNIILLLSLTRYLGIGGLALATSLSSLVTTILLYISLRKKIGSLDTMSTFKSLVKIAFASLGMAVISLLLYKRLSTSISSSMSLISVIIVGAVIYSILIIILKIDGVANIVHSLRKKIKLR
ncbi:murein biosynthesis protein MurJ [Erysipelothrix larvae]|uniref:Probable lipid II flippase MurJ n=1 Tax=Erysipelothrix larvae TaxID=1514105 RepID=A0A0X8GYC9_9FIRM|nr:murein biosynthesis integral membrane protein MurJ [Erysipelothrix larvae]AMC92689.1 murein biosynthesis protein MurJ [Erysipelothrix larvae]